MSSLVRAGLKAIVGPRWTTRFRCALLGLERPRWGNLRRVHQFSEGLGLDGHGNCLVAVAAMPGLAREERSAAGLPRTDPRCPVLATVLFERPRTARP